jgi:hypothetical protein
MTPDAIAAELAEAALERLPIRLHLTDGEVVVAQVLAWDGAELVYAAVTSSRPERYAFCDSAGVGIALAKIERTQVLRGRARPRRR